ncbi:MAG TPA: UDP-N-acetylglucosamine 2-epimerase, partial [Pirellulales bacterium]|nr:UDP-N-acetylglucosamine 2-epimerase [Pirellulales bacterium]
MSDSAKPDNQPPSLAPAPVGETPAGGDAASSRRRKVCVVLVDRANYGRLKPVMHAIRLRPRLDLQVVAAGTMVLERFDQPVRVVRADGFNVDGEIYIELEGSTPATMAKSVGFGVIEFATEFHRLKPDIVLLIGDRYEALAAAIAAAYMNIPILHVQGGEVSGSIDESARHAITKFAQFHFPSTCRAADYLVRMGERPDTILGTGCPSSDIARAIPRQLTSEIVNARGGGVEIDVTKPFLLVIFHPTTTEFGGESRQIQTLLSALDSLKMPALMLWPNIDAGSDHISKMIRVYRTQTGTRWLRTLTNLAPEDYLRVLCNAACAVGNSSS